MMLTRSHLNPTPTSTPSHTTLILPHPHPHIQTVPFCLWVDQCFFAMSAGLNPCAILVISARSHWICHFQVTMSNWEEYMLQEEQIRYAALDALIPGAVFRQLRIWHSSDMSSMPCPTCDNGTEGSSHSSVKPSFASTHCRDPD